MNKSKLLALALAFVPPVALAAVPVPSMPGASTLSGPNGCVKGFVQPSAERLTRALNAAKTRWQTANITAYSFTLEEISQPVRFPRTQVTVSGGAVKAEAMEEGQTSEFSHGASVEGLFGAIEQSIAYARKEPCVEVRVAYGRDGHPLRFSSFQRKAGLADGGATWTVTGFKRQ